ncbi:hypothetical protein EDB86DRAFT_2827379 [Lactarius hatsudake]|nr:hypothetical protein EDB86DRAFT_2827379 [Lactarius hatsudake]
MTEKLTLCNGMMSNLMVGDPLYSSPTKRAASGFRKELLLVTKPSLLELKWSMCVRRSQVQQLVVLSRRARSFTGRQRLSHRSGVLPERKRAVRNGSLTDRHVVNGFPQAAYLVCVRANGDVRKSIPGKRHELGGTDLLWSKQGIPDRIWWYYKQAYSQDAGIDDGLIDPDLDAYVIESCSHLHGSRGVNRIQGGHEKDTVTT